MGDVFADLQKEIDQVFDDFLGRRWPMSVGAMGQFTPLVDVAETADAIDITAELPGCDPKDVEVTATDSTLTIRGEKKSEKETKDRNWQMVERSYGAFVRTLPIPFAVDPAKVDATFDKGLLKIHLPKPPEAKSEAKKITIKS
ncbi:Hsp20/alpha crystallin family protein [Chelatococcus sp. SYSU_G07232]|uniref:Hsp20/alpha crystallin family protein n=1 Tax=Chelatococcus albus TaxID=3047466 RepID=A0ABT7AFA9_9HYPH|nr:Hsp20/alpha crystallin family protein [Chelatococcus sp. SYSU_G07232]MDJ1158055.1 Hsp20/alpha crystallin family protein [Chelatococcus sp. SYSU_G07232]